MKAVVLVGGLGTRLRPLTYTTPKPMLPVGGEPLIARIVGHLGRHGVDEVVLSLGFRPDVFAAAFPDGTCHGVALRYAVEPEPLDTAGAIGFAARAAGIDETFVVRNGDVLCDLDVGELVDLHRARGAEGTVHLHQVEDPSAFGVVPIDDDGRVVAFVEKPARHEAPTDWINAGTYVLEPSVLDRIPAGRRVSIERETFPLLVADRSLFALQRAGYWLDTGTPAQYLQAQADVVARAGGTSIVGAGATIESGARVQGSVLGADVTVRAGGSVLDSVLLDGVTVGPGALVRRSILGRNVVVGAGAVVDGITVVGDDQSIPADAALHGARVPEVQP